MGHPDSPPARLSGAGAAFAAGLAAAWLGLWAGGWPLPNVDDGFFTGAAIHWVGTGTLANPWITGWMQWIPGVRLDRYFVQPPFHPWVMAAWLRIFGISAPSLTGFACAAGAIASGAAARLLRRLGASWTAATLGALMVSSYVLFRGLRPEAAGLACLLAGQGLMLGDGPVGWTAGAILTMASCGFHAFLFALAAPALLLQVAGRVAGGRPSGIALLAVAALATVLLLAAAIHGEFTAFLHDFLGHARLVTPAAGHKLDRFFRQLTLGFEAIPNLLVIGAAGLLVAGLSRREPDFRRPAAAGLAAFLGLAGLGIALYAQFSVSFVVMAAAFGALASTARAPGSWRILLCLPACTLVGWGALEHGLQYRINARTARPAAWAAARRYVAEHPTDAVRFDSATLRYVFGFAPPADAADLSWSWSAGLADRWWSPARLGPRDLWVVNAASLAGSSQAALAPPPLRGLGHPLASLRPSNGLVVIAGEALPAPDPRSFLFLRSSSFVFPTQLR